MVCVIPARGGSKRIPRKNIRDFHGKPIIAYPIQAARDSGLFDKVLVSTEDQEIALTAKKWGADVMWRPLHLTEDHVTDREVVAHLFSVIPVAILCYLYPTAALVSPSILRFALSRLHEEGAELVRVVCEDGRDAGAYWFSRRGAGEARVVSMDACQDIDTEGDWKEAERKYADSLSHQQR
jgi:CMP-N-acetylneuraminic acid synthetase